MSRRGPVFDIAVHRRRRSREGPARTSWRDAPPSAWAGWPEPEPASMTSRRPLQTAGRYACTHAACGKRLISALSWNQAQPPSSMHLTAARRMLLRDTFWERKPLGSLVAAPRFFCPPAGGGPEAEAEREYMGSCVRLRGPRGSFPPPSPSPGSMRPQGRRRTFQAYDRNHRGASELRAQRTPAGPPDLSAGHGTQGDPAAALWYVAHETPRRAPPSCRAPVC